MAAPLNNVFGVGNHRAGRPPKFATPETLHERISEYFDSLGNKLPTITGLALFLDFSSRQSLYDYARKEAFSYSIKRALLLIESGYEEMLTGPNYRNAIFALKAMGWNSKVINTTNVAGQKPPFINHLQSK